MSTGNSGNNSCPGCACFGAGRMKEGFQEETRHLWPRAAGTKEEGAQEAGLSSYLPSSGLAPGGCGSDENTEMLASWALTC